MKELVYQISSNIESVDDGEEVIEKTLLNALIEAWELIHVEYLKELVRSMERGIKAVMEAEG